MSLSAFCIEKTNGLSQRLLTMGKIILLTLLSAHLQNKTTYTYKKQTQGLKNHQLYYISDVFSMKMELSDSTV